MLAADWNKATPVSEETVLSVNNRDESQAFQPPFALARALAQTLVNWFKTHSMTPRLIDALPMPAMVIRMNNPDEPKVVRINRACQTLLSPPIDIDLNHERELSALFPKKDDLVILGSLLKNSQQQTNTPWEFDTSDRPIELSLPQRKREVFFASVAELPWYGEQSALLLLTEPFEEGQRDDLFKKIFSTVPAAVEVRQRLPNDNYQRVAASRKFKEWFPYVKDNQSSALNKLTNFNQFANPSWLNPSDLFIYGNTTFPTYQIDTKQTKKQRSSKDFPEISELRCYRYQIVELSFLNYHFQLHWLQNVTAEWLYRAEQEASLRITHSLVESILTTAYKTPSLCRYSRPLNGEVGGDFFWARYLDDKKNRFILVMGDFPSQSIPAALMTAVAGMTLDHMLIELRSNPDTATPENIRDKFQAEIDQRLNRRVPSQETTVFVEQVGRKLDLLVLTLSRQDDNRVLRYTQSGIALFHLSSVSEARQLTTPASVSQERLPFLSNSLYGKTDATPQWQSNFESNELLLTAGDRLIMCTDGLIKQRIPSPERKDSYGSSRLVKLLNDHTQTEDGEIVLTSIIKDWQDTVGEVPIGDDVLVITITPCLVIN